MFSFAVFCGERERVFSITFSRLFVAMPQRCLFHSAKPGNPLLVPSRSLVPIMYIVRAYFPCR